MDELDMEKKVYSADDLPEWHGKLSEVFVPRLVFVMQTKHVGITRENVEKTMDTKLDFALPQEARKALLDSIYKRISEASEGVKKEYHAMAIVQDMSTNTYNIVVGQGNVKGGQELCKKDVPRLALLEGWISGSQSIAAMYASCETTIAHMRYSPEWNGEREKMAQIECESLADANAKLDAEGLGDIWRELIPQDTAAVAPPVAGEVVELTPAKEAELAKRFGKRNIAQLKKRIAASKKKAI